MAEKPDKASAQAMLRAIANLSNEELAFLGRRIEAANRNLAKERDDAIANGWN